MSINDDLIRSKLPSEEQTWNNDIVEGVSQIEDELDIMDATIEKDLANRLRPIEKDVTRMDNNISGNINGSVDDLQANISTIDREILNTFNGQVERLSSVVADAENCLLPPGVPENYVAIPLNLAQLASNWIPFPSYYGSGNCYWVLPQEAEKFYNEILPTLELPQPSELMVAPYDQFPECFQQGDSIVCRTVAPERWKQIADYQLSIQSQTTETIDTITQPTDTQAGEYKPVVRPEDVYTPPIPSFEGGDGNIFIANTVEEATPPKPPTLPQPPTKPKPPEEPKQQPTNNLFECCCMIVNAVNESSNRIVDRLNLLLCVILKGRKNKDKEEELIEEEVLAKIRPDDMAIFDPEWLKGDNLEPFIQVGPQHSNGQQTGQTL